VPLLLRDEIGKKRLDDLWVVVGHALGLLHQILVQSQIDRALSCFHFATVPHRASMGALHAQAHGNRQDQVLPRGLPWSSNVGIPADVDVEISWHFLQEYVDP